MPGIGDPLPESARTVFDNVAEAHKKAAGAEARREQMRKDFDRMKEEARKKREAAEATAQKRAGHR